MRVLAEEDLVAEALNVEQEKTLRLRPFDLRLQPRSHLALLRLLLGGVRG